MVVHLGRVEYPPRKDAVAVLLALSRAASRVVISTGRPERLRASTYGWLSRHFRFHDLLMRCEGDFRHNEEIKREYLERLIMPRRRAGEPVCAFEDDPDALLMYESAGVRTFTAPQCWAALLKSLGQNGPLVERA